LRVLDSTQVASMSTHARGADCRELTSTMCISDFILMRCSLLRGEHSASGRAKKGIPQLGGNTEAQIGDAQPCSVDSNEQLGVRVTM
jgi:hypothetical protein